MHLKQEYLKAIFDDAPIGLGIIQRGKIKFINRLGLRIFGYDSENEILNKRISSIIFEETYDKIKALLKTPKNIPDILELKGRRKDGTPFPFRIDISQIQLNGSLAQVLYLTDLSEIRRTEKSWQESELRYFSLVNNSPSAIAIHNEGKIVYVNPSAIKMLKGKSADEFEGKKITDFIHPKYHDLMTERIKKLLDNKNVPPIEEKIIRSDGTEIDVVVQAAPVIFENNPAIQVVITDITEQKQNERAIVESEKSYRGLFNNASDAIYIQAKNGSFLDVNESVTVMYGYPREFFIGKSPADLSAPGKNDLDALKKRLEKAYKGEPQMFNFWGKKKDGTVFPKEVRLSSGTYFGKKVIFAFARDISKRYAAESALKKSEARFRTLIEKSPVPIGMSRNGKLIFANDAYVKIFGYGSVRQIIGKPFIAEVAPAQREVITKQNKKREAGQFVPASYESVGLRKDGSTFPFLADVSLINLDDGLATLVFLKDLSEIKKAESEKLEFERQLLHAQKLESLGVLAGGIAHDFNNILMSVLGNAELAEYNLPDDHPAKSGVIAIQNAARRAAELTNQMLAYSGKGKFIIKPVNLSELVKEMTQMMKVSISKKANLNFDCHDNLPLIEADVAQIQQVIINLITNASEALNDKQGTITVKTGTTSERTGTTSNSEELISQKFSIGWPDQKSRYILEDLKEKRGAILTIHDYIKLAKEGNQISVDIVLEYVPAVEHFANHKNAQTFLTVDFTIECLGSTNYYERCLACYPTEEADGEKKIAAEVANERLRLLYQEFDGVGITYEKHFFE